MRPCVAAVVGPRSPPDTPRAATTRSPPRPTDGRTVRIAHARKATNATAGKAMATGSVQAPWSRTMNHSHGNSTGSTPHHGNARGGGRSGASGSMAPERTRVVCPPCGNIAPMSDAPDFRLEHSELISEDEFSEFTSTDLPYYSDWRGSFEKLPWATDDESLRAANADIAIVGAPLDEGTSSRPGARFGPRAIRMAPTAWSSDYAWSIQLDVEPYAARDGRRRRRCAGRPHAVRARPARDPREGVPRGERRRHPDRAGRRSFDHLSRAWPPWRVTSGPGRWA